MPSSRVLATSPRLIPGANRRPWRRWAVAAVLGACAAGSASSQNLLDLYQAARSYDATYLAARALAESAEYRLAQTRALQRPVAGLSGNVTRSESELPNGASRGNTSSGITLQGRQPLFNASNRVTVEQAERLFDVSRHELETAEQDLIVRVAQAYFDVLAAQDTLATTRTSKAAINEQLASARRNFEVGNATITDTREAQARFDLATAQEIAAENDLLTRRIALDQLVGRNGVEPAPLATPLALPDVGSPMIDDWLSRADAAHPLVLRARLALDIARLETEKARAGHLPTIDAVASLGTNRLSGANLNTVPGTTTGASVGLQLNLPLFAGYSVQNRIRETLQLEERSRNELEAARRGVSQGTRQAYFGLQSGRAQVSALEAAESSSALALEATQLGYRVGVRVNLDVLNAQTQLFTTRRDLARSRYEVLLGALRLRQAAGQLAVDDVAEVNRFLAR